MRQVLSRCLIVLVHCFSFLITSFLAMALSRQRLRSRAELRRNVVVRLLWIRKVSNEILPTGIKCKNAESWYLKLHASSTRMAKDTWGRGAHPVLCLLQLMPRP